MTPYFQDDLVTIYHGDALDVMGHVRGRADLILTDPPYGLNRAYGGQNRSKRARRRIHGDESSHLLLWTASESVTWARDDAWGALFCGWNTAHLVREKAEQVGWRVKTVIVWDKGRFTPVGRGVRDQHEFIVLIQRGTPETPWDGGNVWRFSRVHAPEHPNEKPDSLMRATISRLLPADQRRLVVDPFAGSGSTLAAAKSLGHRAIGVEVNERYCEMAANRCRQETLFSEPNGQQHGTQTGFLDDNGEAA